MYRWWFEYCVERAYQKTRPYREISDGEFEVIHECIDAHFGISTVDDTVVAIQDALRSGPVSDCWTNW